MEIIALLLLFGLVWFLLARFVLRRLTIYEYQCGLKYSNGRYTGKLSPGAHWYFPYFTAIKTVDLRPCFVTVPGQEVLSADHVSLKCSLAVKYEVVDPHTAVNKIDNYQTALYLELQVALRGIIGSAPVDQLLEQRDQLGARLLELCVGKGRALGIQILSVNIKDIMFPGQLKTIFTQVIKARKEGLATLEKARGETAALRNLANAAQLVERNPALLQLRALQSATGNTVIVGMPSQTTPVPIKSESVEKGEVPQIEPPSKKNVDD